MAIACLSRSCRVLALVGCAVFASGAHLSSVWAVTFTVNSTLDQPDDLTIPGTCHTVANTCTLRAAVMQANRSTGVGATIIVPAGTYLLTIPSLGTNGETSGDLNLTAPAAPGPVISIVGAGAGVTIIDGNQLDRIFHVHKQRTATIAAMTIQNGFASPFTTPGTVRVAGAILNEGSLTITDVMIRDNTGEAGGGLCNCDSGASLNIVNSTIYRNKAKDGAGLITSGSAALIGSVVSENVATGLGGGLYNSLDLTVRSSTVSGNTANNGGGIYNYKNLFVISSTISSNNAKTDGGGLYNDGTSNIYSSSIVSNGADSDADPNGGIAAGIFNQISTIAQHPSVAIRNTLVAANYLSGSPVYDDCQGNIDVYGRNLFGTVRTGCTLTAGGGGSWSALNSLNALGPLQDNGGGTPTHALLAGSNAIDGGDPALGCVGPDVNPLPTDQRGAPRVKGARCDIGAFEFSAGIDVDLNGTYDALTDGVLITRYLFGLSGQMLTTNAIGNGAIRRTPESITSYLQGIRGTLDIDNNTVPDAMTDGLLILRYMFGLRGPALVNGAVGPSAGRGTSATIEPYIQSLMP